MDASKFLENLASSIIALDNETEIGNFLLLGYKKYSGPWDRKNGFEFKDNSDHIIRFRITWDFPHHDKLTDYIVFEVIKGLDKENIADCQLKGNNFYLYHNQVQWIDNYKLNVRMDQKLTLDRYYELMKQFRRPDKTIIRFNPNSPDYTEIIFDILEWVFVRYRVKTEIKLNPHKYFE
jgi:hypothetical protein